MKKNFLKAKKGNYAIFAIMFVPLVISLVASIVTVKRNKTVYESEIKTSLSSFFQYENNYNGIVSIKNNGDNTYSEYCLYSNIMQTKIKEDFAVFFTQIDGYNKFWNYETIQFVVNDNNSYISFKCVCYIPKIKTLKVIDYWGIDYGVYETKDGYYQTHSNSMETLYKKGKDDTDYWQKIEIEVNSSCV